MVSAHRSIRGELVSGMKLRHKAFIRSLSPKTASTIIQDSRKTRGENIFTNSPKTPSPLVLNLKSANKNQNIHKDTILEGIVKNREKVMKELHLGLDNKAQMQKIFMLGSDLFKRSYGSEMKDTC